ncbi:hypothetical protein F5Y15DRAFT_401870 [Xylariaceae sp. FL0016]|nr:hypothetical protein F5Y15DRAFT_401870 [Xylariaceae sp. FL0016]
MIRTRREAFLSSRLYAALSFTWLVLQVLAHAHYKIICLLEFRTFLPFKVAYTQLEALKYDEKAPFPSRVIYISDCPAYSELNDLVKERHAQLPVDL